MIDFELLKKADIEVVNTTLTPEDKREISVFLKAYRAKEARSKTTRTLRDRASSVTRKKAK
jgi:hypothetical protein